MLYWLYAACTYAQVYTAHLFPLFSSCETSALGKMVPLRANKFVQVTIIIAKWSQACTTFHNTPSTSHCWRWWLRQEYLATSFTWYLIKITAKLICITDREELSFWLLRPTLCEHPTSPLLALLKTKNYILLQHIMSILRHRLSQRIKRSHWVIFN